MKRGLLVSHISINMLLSNALFLLWKMLCQVTMRNELFIKNWNTPNYVKQVMIQFFFIFLFPVLRASVLLLSYLTYKSFIMRVTAKPPADMVLIVYDRVQYSLGLAWNNLWKKRIMRLKYSMWDIIYIRLLSFEVFTEQQNVICRNAPACVFIYICVMGYNAVSHISDL